jgi:hypothetical protein
MPGSKAAALHARASKDCRIETREIHLNAERSKMYSL